MNEVISNEKDEVIPSESPRRRVDGPAFDLGAPGLDFETWEIRSGPFAFPWERLLTH
jgi:hypothetical protein